jgi:hypothetical protein
MRLTLFDLNGLLASSSSIRRVSRPQNTGPTLTVPKRIARGDAVANEKQVGWAETEQDQRVPIDPIEKTPPCR